MYPDLNGRSAVVTGGARGMGASHASALLNNGVNVLITDIEGDAAAATAERLGREHGAGGPRVVSMQMDVRHPEAHERAAARAIAEFGHLDIWINNAGIFCSTPAIDVQSEELAEVFGVNVNGMLFGAQAAMRHFKGSGTVINMASVSGQVVRAGDSTYGVSKAAVDHLTRFLAVEWGPQGVRVNAIAPGLVATEMAAWVNRDPETYERVVQSIPLRRLGQPDEISDVMLFLASDASRFVNGHTLIADGGGRLR